MGWHITSVGASLLAKVVNDDAGCLVFRGVLEFFASKLAPTVGGSAGQGGLGGDYVAGDDYGLVIEVDVAVTQRDVHVARGLAGAADFGVGPGGEQEVAVERPGVHAHAVVFVVQAHGRPLRPWLQAPADVGDAVYLGVVEVFHVVAQVFSLKATVDFGDEALFDFQGDFLAGVGFEWQQDVADIQHQHAFGRFFIGPGEQEAAGPVIPASRLVGKPVFGD